MDEVWDVESLARYLFFHTDPYTRKEKKEKEIKPPIRINRLKSPLAVSASRKVFNGSLQNKSQNYSVGESPKIPSPRSELLYARK